MNYFLICIAARLFLVYAATQKKLQKPLIVFLLAVAAAWLAMSTGLIDRDRGREAGGKIWWQHLRMLHAVNYLLAVYFLLKGFEIEAAAILFSDIALGTFFRYRFRRAPLRKA